MVKEISSAGEFNSEIKGPGLVVVDYFATWCGPCKNIAPFVEELSRKYPQVKFLKVDSDKVQEVCSERRISSLPTFQFFVKGNQVDEIKGADPAALEAKVNQHKCDPVDSFAGKMVTLGGSSVSAGPAVDPREARLRFMGLTVDQKTTEPLKVAGVTSADSSADSESANKKTRANEDEEADDQAEAEAELLAEDTASAEWDEEMVPVPVEAGALADLIEMGFSDVKARKGLVHGKSVDGALAWLSEHQDDADIDQPYMVRKADTVPKPVLTKEEQEARLLAIKEKIKNRKAMKAQTDKVDEIRKEKERRLRGQSLGETQEERDRLQRKRENEKIKKEKDAAKMERERLRAEIARDKEARRANKGVLPSVLGVDGYNPSAPQYDIPDSGLKMDVSDEKDSLPAAQPAVKAAPVAAPKVVKAPLNLTAAQSATAAGMGNEEKIDNAIQTIMRYRTNGDGGNALKLLLTFVKNILDNPTDAKYRSINTESNAFKSKLGPLVGPVVLLKALGFVKNEDEGKFVLDGECPLLASTVAKLTQAGETYKTQNPEYK